MKDHTLKCVGILGSMIVGMLIGMYVGIDGCQKQAVKAGVGRYVADPSTGATRFVYGVENGY